MNNVLASLIGGILGIAYMSYTYLGGLCLALAGILIVLALR